MINKIKDIYKKAPKWLKTKYTLSIFIFLIWMMFFDPTNVFVHIKKNQNIQNALQEKNYLEEEIKKTKEEIDVLKQPQLTPTLVKKYRESYFLRRNNEEIFLTQQIWHE